MPPLPAVPGVIKLIISGARSDGECLNILHIGYSGGPPSAANLTSYLSGTVEPAAVTLYDANASTDYEGATIEAIDLSSDTGASASVAFSSAGSRTGDFAPVSACVVCSWDIARRYRGGHPRTYFPFGTAGTYEASSAKYWDSGFIAGVQGDVTTFSDSIAGITEGSTEFQNLVNVSYVDKNLNPTPPYRRTTPVVDVITGSLVKQRICSQRRRLGKLLG